MHISVSFASPGKETEEKSEQQAPLCAYVLWTSGLGLLRAQELQLWVDRKPSSLGLMNPCPVLTNS